MCFSIKEIIYILNRSAKGAEPLKQDDNDDNSALHSEESSAVKTEEQEIALMSPDLNKVDNEDSSPPIKGEFRGLVNKDSATTPAKARDKTKRSSTMRIDVMRGMKPQSKSIQEVGKDSILEIWNAFSLNQKYIIVASHSYL